MKISVIFRHWRLLVPMVLLATLALPFVIDRHISESVQSACYDQIEDIESRPIALVLGTARTFNGRMNPFYTTRISAAAKLFKAGKIRGILVSGDNGSKYYDEPTNMRDDLVEAGVPVEFITLDYAGFRTRDSIIRAKETFQQEEVIIVTQRFHAERALYIARQEGLTASAFIAKDPESRVSNAKVRTREVLARTLAVVDCLLGKSPRFLGETEQVALRD